jgi:hypothetical protein
LEIGSFRYPSLTIENGFEHANAKRVNFKDNTTTYNSNATHAVIQFFEFPVEKIIFV